jgi:CheY-like chemotaxis protein
MGTKELVRAASEFLAEAKYSKSLLNVLLNIKLGTVTKGSKPLVLCVEDDEDTLSMLQHMLEARGYQVLAANSVDKALELAATHDNIHSLVTDYHIHGRTAADLLAALGNRKPKNVVLLSGRHFSNDPKKEVPGIDSHVMKPIWDPSKLIEKIDVNDERDSVTPPTQAG